MESIKSDGVLTVRWRKKNDNNTRSVPLKYGSSGLSWNMSEDGREEV